MRRIIKTVYDSNGAGRQIPVTRDLFTYNVEFDSLSQGASTTVAVNFENDSSFVWTKSSMSIYISGQPDLIADFSTFVPQLTVSINDAGSSRNWLHSPTPISTISGNGGLPFIIPEPQTFQGNSTVLFSFTNYSTGITYSNFQLSLLGYKEWR